MSDALLDVEGVVKRFRGLIALRRIDLQVQRGEILSIVGANGSGKTTLLDCIQGVHVPDEGDISLDGQSIVGFRLDQIVRLGIVRTYQSVRLFETMPAAEQVLTGMHCRLRTGLFGALMRTSRARREERQAWYRVNWLLDYVGLRDKGDVPPALLSYHEQRCLELARVLAAEPCLLLLDGGAGDGGSCPDVRLDPPTSQRARSDDFAGRTHYAGGTSRFGSGFTARIWSESGRRLDRCHLGSNANDGELPGTAL